MNNLKKTRLCFSLRHPQRGLKCKVCKKKNCEFFCPHCKMVYCGSSCVLKDMDNHLKICAQFWCAIDTEERKRGHYNPIPCETLLAKRICFGCHKIKQLKTKLCANCKTARYCSVECQNKDWIAVHQKGCSTYQSFRCARKRKKNLAKNGVKIPYWSIIKNGKALPKKYQTKQEATEGLFQVIGRKEDAIYVLSYNPAAPPRSKPHHHH